MFREFRTQEHRPTAFPACTEPRTAGRSHALFPGGTTSAPRELAPHPLLSLLSPLAVSKAWVRACPTGKAPNGHFQQDLSHLTGQQWHRQVNARSPRGQEADYQVSRSPKGEELPPPAAGCSSRGKRTSSASRGRALTCFVLNWSPLDSDFRHRRDQRVVTIALTDEVNNLICDVFDGVFIFPAVFCGLQKKLYH